MSILLLLRCFSAISRMSPLELVLIMWDRCFVKQWCQKKSTLYIEFDVCASICQDTEVCKMLVAQKIWAQHHHFLFFKVKFDFCLAVSLIWKTRSRYIQTSVCWCQLFTSIIRETHQFKVRGETCCDLLEKPYWTDSDWAFKGIVTHTHTEVECFISAGHVEHKRPALYWLDKSNNWQQLAVFNLYPHADPSHRRARGQRSQQILKNNRSRLRANLSGSEPSDSPSVCRRSHGEKI